MLSFSSAFISLLYKPHISFSSACDLFKNQFSFTLSSRKFVSLTISSSSSAILITCRINFFSTLLISCALLVLRVANLTNLCPSPILLLIVSFASLTKALNSLPSGVESLPPFIASSASSLLKAASTTLILASSKVACSFLANLSSSLSALSSVCDFFLSAFLETLVRSFALIVCEFICNLKVLILSFRILPCSITLNCESLASSEVLIGLPSASLILFKALAAHVLEVFLPTSLT